jgi:Na+-driven multidrug efflux pump
MLQNQIDRTDRRPAAPSARRASPTLVEGPIARTLLMFSLPILGSSVLQSLNASINAAWIGRLIGANALSASANANSIMFFLMSAGFGMGMAATILVGQALGSSRSSSSPCPRFISTPSP